MRQRLLLALLCAGVCGVLALQRSNPSAISAAEPATKLPNSLQYVPSDASLFLHVDLAKVWSSPIGDELRKAKAKDLDKQLATLKTATGLTLDDLVTVTLWMPPISGDGPSVRLGVIVTTKKDYSREAILKFLKEEAKEMKITEDKGIITVAEKGKSTDATVIDTTDLKKLIVYHHLPEALRTKQPANETAAFLPAFKIVQDGAPLVAAINFDKLPEDIRKEDLPAEIRPFQPLFKSQVLIAKSAMDKKNVNLSLKFVSKNRANAMECEKSLEAARIFFKSLIVEGTKEVEGMKKDGKDLVPLMKMLATTIKEAKVFSEGNEAEANLSFALDFSLAPILEMAFGVGSAAENARSQNNLKQLGLAFHSYTDAHNQFPPPYTLSKKGKKLLSWRVHLLPYVEQENLYKKFKLDEPWDSEENMKVLKENPMPKVFELPGSETNAKDKTTHYQVLWGNGAVWDPGLPLSFKDVTDGTSNTAMIFALKKAIPWTAPDDPEFEPKSEIVPLLLFANDRCNITMCDGSVRGLSKKISEDTLKAYITRGGGEVVSDEEK